MAWLIRRIMRATSPDGFQDLPPGRGAAAAQAIP